VHLGLVVQPVGRFYLV